MIKTLKLIFGVAVSGICLWLVFRGFDFTQLKTALEEASYVWLCPAMVIFSINMFLRSIRWRTLLSPIKHLRLAQVFPVLLTGFFMNNVLPARAGELVRAVAIGRESDIPVSSALGSIVIERLTDMLGLLMILIIAAKLLPWEKLPLTPILTVLVMGLIISLALVVWMEKYRNKFQHDLGLVGKIVRLISQVMDGFLALKSPLKMSMVLLLSCAIWINELLIALLISYAMHLNLSFFETAGLLTGLSVGVMIPAAPGYIGTFEFFGKEILIVLGKSAAQALPFVLVLHFFQLTMMAIIGIPSIFILQASRKSTAPSPMPEVS